ncbi:hypothetical protein E4U41_002806, partial [Claviceps citrina]
MKLSPTCLRCRALGPRPRAAIAVRNFTASSSNKNSNSTSNSTSNHKRPSMAPKPIIDIKDIRQNPELYEMTCRKRNYTAQAQHPAKIIQLHAQWQHLQKQGRSLRERSNLLRKFLANPATSSGDDDLADIRALSRDQVQDEARQLKAQLSDIERGEAAA